MNARAMSPSQVAADLLSLTKPGLSSLVLCTTAGGLWLAPGPLSVPKVVVVLLATYGIVGAANTLNCFLERDSDRSMRRTRNRPLPAGRMEPGVALWFGIALAAISVPALMLGANVLTGAIGLLAFLLYVLVYTPMKPRSWVAMLLGAVPGALPPLMGWTAVAGRIAPPAVVLSGILFFWQLPHFTAIALFRKDEYRAAGLTSLPLALGDAASRAHVLFCLLALVPLTLLPAALGIAGPLYLAAALALDAFFLGVGAVGFFRRLGAEWARQLFFTSLAYLAGLFTALMVSGPGA